MITNCFYSTYMRTVVIDDIVLLRKHNGIDIIEEQKFKDKFGNDHRIYEFTNLDKFEEHIVNRNENNVFFDIDLDYFIESEGLFNDRDSWSLMDEKK